MGIKKLFFYLIKFQGIKLNKNIGLEMKILILVKS